MREKLTVVIPTHERHQLLEQRALPNVLKLGCRVVVVDSSAAPDAYAANHPGIDYAHVPGQLLTRKMQAPVRDMVKTPYILLCADDTVMSPGGVAACLDHLERHADYSSAMGLWFEVPYGGGAPSCPQYERFPYAVDSDRPGDRLLQNFQMFFTTFYAVHRAEVWQDVLRLCPENIYNYYLFETYVVLMASIHGKLAKIPAPYALMEAGPSINDRNPRFHCSPFKLATDPRYREEVRAVRDVVERYLAERAGVPLEQARVGVDGALALYWLQDKPIRTCSDKVRREWRRLLEKTLFRSRAKAEKARKKKEAAARRERVMERVREVIGPEGRLDLENLAKQF